MTVLATRHFFEQVIVSLSAQHHMEQYRKSSDKVAFVLGMNDSPQPPSLFSHIELDARAEGRDDVLLTLKWVASAFGKIDPKYVTIGALLKLARVEAMGKLLVIRIAIGSGSTEITLLVLEALRQAYPSSWQVLVHASGFTEYKAFHDVHVLSFLHEASPALLERVLTRVNLEGQDVADWVVANLSPERHAYVIHRLLRSVPRSVPELYQGLVRTLVNHAPSSLSYFRNWIVKDRALVEQCILHGYGHKVDPFTLLKEPGWVERYGADVRIDEFVNDSFMWWESDNSDLAALLAASGVYVDPHRLASAFGRTGDRLSNTLAPYLAAQSEEYRERFEAQCAFFRV